LSTRKSRYRSCCKRFRCCRHSCNKTAHGYGLKKVILCDTKGAIYDGRDNLNSEKALIAKISNLEKKKGTLEDVIKGADVFIGLSVPGTVTKDMVKSMAKDPIIFAMANPTPEIMPDEAKEAGAKVVVPEDPTSEPDKQRSCVPRNIQRCA